MTCITCDGTLRVSVLCSRCNGLGCERCHGSGEVWITCPDCEITDEGAGWNERQMSPRCGDGGDE